VSLNAFALKAATSAVIVGNCTVVTSNDLGFFIDRTFRAVVGGASLHASQNMESLINKCTNKYICVCSLFKVRGAREAWQKKGEQPLVWSVTTVIFGFAQMD